MQHTFDIVGIVGTGAMGRGIAQIAAQAGSVVRLFDTQPAAVERAIQELGAQWDRLLEKGRMDSASVQSAKERLRPAASLRELADCELVIEAVIESKAAKLEVFRRLSDVVEDPESILASNTSSIPIVELATATRGRAEHVLGLHFFNPVPVLSLVEIIPSLLTSKRVSERADRFAADQLGKDPIVAPDRAGFTVNALLIPYVLSAIRMFEQGLASAEDIDRGMVKGCAHPMGPLALADLIGLDTVMGVAETLYAEQREQFFAPPLLLQRLVAAGLLGRKSGRGLYNYA